MASTAVDVSWLVAEWHAVKLKYMAISMVCVPLCDDPDYAERYAEH
jgi:hypothetical protein